MHAQYTQNMTSSLIQIQKLYASEYKYVSKPKSNLENLDKILIGKINEKSGKILFQIASDACQLLKNDCEVCVKPVFGKLEESYTLREDEQCRRGSYITEWRERSILYVEERMPIKKITISHNIKDVTLAKEIDKAVDLANQFFHESNLSFLDWISEKLDCFAISI